MKNYKQSSKLTDRYGIGAIFGMMCEYLYRVEVSPLPVVITTIIGAGILIDILYYIFSKDHEN